MLTEVPRSGDASSPSLWRVWFRHAYGIDGITSNTWTLADAIAMQAQWSTTAKTSLVPAGTQRCPGPACATDLVIAPRHDLCSGAACSCSCHAEAARC